MSERARGAHGAFVDVLGAALALDEVEARGFFGGSGTGFGAGFAACGVPNLAQNSAAVRPDASMA